ncbi:alkaline phosphatase D family protein [Fuerstiella marisgermanici]|uniref:Alkaline phosphatase D n=1 Tax=Fuerstiella marisgermanici TaxID=1891926 RepID=A0A1P8WBG9_9PLAN|nr:alkaline phosphatase D family protein [Fuerstiella marisgermanici]APZ91410.1 Alkaline phosphatase D precursor [Fuerstiella marisgermanici]
MAKQFLGLSIVFLLSSGTQLHAEDTVGPYVGTLKTTEAYLLYRPGNIAAELRLTVNDEQGKKVAAVESRSEAEHDFVAKFHVAGLNPGTTYRYQIENIKDGNATLVAGGTPDFHFTTVPTERGGQVLNVAFISCVNDATDPVWQEMANHDLDLLCFGGDTPYADTGDLVDLRNKHRHLLQRPPLAALGKNVSLLGTWDDHDFGKNNGNGKSAAALKDNTRRSFVEYRVQDQYGTGDAGIYQKTDRGAMEVFLLDARWYSQTGPSPVSPDQSTCFGNDQWQWLLESLRKSKAPFKVLLQGQIWQDKKNRETDDMYTYYAERDALLDFIKNERIPGVVLVGGDIHVSRYLMHAQRVGYDLHDFIISPGHTSTIPSLNVYHQDLEWSRVEPNQFLKMTADTTKEPPVLTVKFLDKDGQENLTKTITYDQLTPQPETGIAKALRAYWSFDGNTKNNSRLGDRLDGELNGGAEVSKENGVRGGALQLSRADSQHLTVPRSMLDDNASVYTVSSLIKPASLPAHGSTDRSFVMESNVNNHCDLPYASNTGLPISIGFRACEDADRINLQLYTETLVPQPVGSERPPGTKVQGGFDHLMHRSQLSDWTHVAVTFDSSQLQLFVNGKLAGTHKLPISAPIAETGGLVIGGHRAGTGRNFDGMIDEVAIWNRVLAESEIAAIYSNGTPPAVREN